MPPMPNNPNLPYFPFPTTSGPFMNGPMNGLGGGQASQNNGASAIKSDGGSPANDTHNHGNGSPQLPKLARPNDAQNTPPQREEYRPYGGSTNPAVPFSYFGRMPWDDQPNNKEQSNGALSLSGILHNSTGSASSAGEGSGPGNKDSKSGIVEANGHHNNMMNGHSFSAQSHLAHHNELNETQNGKSNGHEGLHGELTAL